MEKKSKSNKNITIFFAGLGFVDSNEYIYNDSKNRLLSFEGDKQRIDEFISLLKGEKNESRRIYKDN